MSATDVESRRRVEIGGSAGFLREAESWSDYIADIDARFTPHREALRQAIIARAVRRGDDWQQTAPDGVPVFDDGAIGLLSHRAWSDLMAATWVCKDGRGYSYMSFYVDSCVEETGMTLGPPSMQ